MGWPTRVRVTKGGRVVWDSGGAHCCWTLYFLALAPAVRMLLRYEAGNAGGVAIVDLNGDGRPELVLGDDYFAYFDTLCYACSPARVPLVACFSGGRFHDCTRRFPDFVRKEITLRTSELRDLVAQTPRDEEVVQSVRGAALGLYATYALLGEEQQRWEAVRAIAPTTAPTWLARHRGRVRQWAAARGKRLASR